MKKALCVIFVVLLVGLFVSCTNPVVATPDDEEETLSNVGYMVIRAVWEDPSAAKATISVEEEDVNQVEIAIGQNSQEVGSFIFERQHPSYVWTTQLDPGTYDVFEVIRDKDGHKTGIGGGTFIVRSGKNTRIKVIPGGTLTMETSWENIVLSSDKTSVEANGANYATLTATVPSSVTSIEFAITNGSGMLSANSVTPINGVATVNVTPVASLVSGTLTVSASAAGLATTSITVATTASSITPYITFTSNRGMRLIYVGFNEKVDRNSAETTLNYEFRNNKDFAIQVLGAKLLSDDKTVQLFLNSGIYNDSVEDSLLVKNIQNIDQTATISTVTKTLTVIDTSAPTISSLEALSSSLMRVTFSEAIKGAIISSFKLDDRIINGYVDYPNEGDYTKAIIHFNNPLSAGSHTLTIGVNGKIYDYKTTSTGIDDPYIMQPAGYVVTVTANAAKAIGLSSISVRRDDSILAH